MYNNREFYYNLMLDFLHEKISAWTFRTKYWDQRHKNLDENKTTGYSDYYVNRVLFGNEKIFEEKYSDLLYRKAWSENCLNILQEYEKGAKELSIK